MINKNRHSPIEDVKTANPNMRSTSLGYLDWLYSLIQAIELDRRKSAAKAYGLFVFTGYHITRYDYEKTIIQKSSEYRLNFKEKMIVFNFLKEACLVSDIKETRTYQTFRLIKSKRTPAHERRPAGVNRVERFEPIASPDYIIKSTPEHHQTIRLELDIDKEIEDYIYGVLNAGR